MNSPGDPYSTCWKLHTIVRYSGITNKPNMTIMLGATSSANSRLRTSASSRMVGGMPRWVVAASRLGRLVLRHDLHGGGMHLCRAFVDRELAQHCLGDE